MDPPNEEVPATPSSPSSSDDTNNNSSALTETTLSLYTAKVFVDMARTIAQFFPIEEFAQAHQCAVGAVSQRSVQWSLHHSPIQSLSGRTVACRSPNMGRARSTSGRRMTSVSFNPLYQGLSFTLPQQVPRALPSPRLLPWIKVFHQTVLIKNS